MRCVPILVFAVNAAFASAAAQGAPERVSFPAQDSVVIHALQYGAGSNGLVLAHGGRYNKESWDAQARILADSGFRVLAFDFRGHGESRARDGAQRGAGRHLDVLGAIDYLRRTGATTISVIGSSMGGDYAIEAVELRPEPVDRLVVIAGGAYTPLRRMRGPKLFIMSRDDIIGENTPRMPAIRAQFDNASGPKEFVVLDGRAHAQDIFRTAEGERLMREMLRFLRAP